MAENGPGSNGRLRPKKHLNDGDPAFSARGEQGKSHSRRAWQGINASIQKIFPRLKKGMTLSHA